MHGSGSLMRTNKKPNVKQRDHLTISRLSNLLQNGVEEYLEHNVAILDLGCGNKLHQSLFLEKSVMYIGADVDKSTCANITCDGQRVLFREPCFSVCLRLQVLEHVDEPNTVVDEILKVLKLGGLFSLQVPSSWIIHGVPHDYWRWTEYGLKNRLQIFVSIKSIRTEVLLPFNYWNSIRRKSGILIILLNVLGDLLDRNIWINAKFPDLAANYFVVTRK